MCKQPKDTKLLDYPYLAELKAKNTQTALPLPKMLFICWYSLPIMRDWDGCVAIPHPKRFTTLLCLLQFAFRCTTSIMFSNHLYVQLVTMSVSSMSNDFNENWSSFPVSTKWDTILICDWKSDSTHSCQFQLNPTFHIGFPKRKLA